MNSINSWKPELYDSKLGFVSEFGRGVVALLDPKPQETILDLGCGTGDLTHEIAKTGAIVTGMDLSAPMIGKARSKYPDIEFTTGNAQSFHLEGKFDAVFSNAALHWMKEASQVIACVWDALRHGGRFVAEFGGKGNVGLIADAIAEVLSRDFGIDNPLDRNPWFFPSIGEYSQLLESQGFRVAYACHFDRDTKLEDGEDGLDHWLTSFGDDFFCGVHRGAEKDNLQQNRLGAKKRAFFSRRFLVRGLQAAADCGFQALSFPGFPLSEALNSLSIVFQVAP